MATRIRVGAVTNQRCQRKNPSLSRREQLTATPSPVPSRENARAAWEENTAQEPSRPTRTRGVADL